MDEQFFVYILYSKTSDKYYIGYTSDIKSRLQEHNDLSADNSKFCVKNGPWELKYYEAGYKSRTDAGKREKQIKSWKSRKMIEKMISSCTISSVGIPTSRRGFNQRVWRFSEQWMCGEHPDARAEPEGRFVRYN